jgi:hypothetical protein
VGAGDCWWQVSVGTGTYVLAPIVTSFSRPLASGLNSTNIDFAYIQFLYQVEKHLFC